MLFCAFYTYFYTSVYLPYQNPLWLYLNKKGSAISPSQVDHSHFAIVIWAKKLAQNEASQTFSDFEKDWFISFFWYFTASQGTISVINWSKRFSENNLFGPILGPNGPKNLVKKVWNLIFDQMFDPFCPKKGPKGFCYENSFRPIENTYCSLTWCK